MAKKRVKMNLQKTAISFSLFTGTGFLLFHNISGAIAYLGLYATMYSLKRNIVKSKKIQVEKEAKYYMQAVSGDDFPVTHEISSKTQRWPVTFTVPSESHITKETPFKIVRISEPKIQRRNEPQVNAKKDSVPNAFKPEVKEIKNNIVFSQVKETPKPIEEHPNIVYMSDKAKKLLGNGTESMISKIEIKPVSHDNISANLSAAKNVETSSAEFILEPVAQININNQAIIEKEIIRDDIATEMGPTDLISNMEEINRDSESNDEIFQSHIIHYIPEPQPPVAVESRAVIEPLYEETAYLKSQEFFPEEYLDTEPLIIEVTPANNTLKKDSLSLYNSLDKDELLLEKITKLSAVLKEYGITASIKDFQIGPTVIRIEVVVEIGTRVKRIVSLQDDIAMHLEAKSVRIEAPIPGKNAIGIEIPNDNPETVLFKDIVNKNQLKDKNSLSIILGKDIVGKDIIVDLKKMPHLLIAGRTGAGKSVCINTLISSLLTTHNSDSLKLILIDPKMVELMPYNTIPHLLTPVITEPKFAPIALKWAVNEMEQRYKELSRRSIRNIDGYNHFAAQNNIPKLPYIVIIIDELADLMMTAPASIEEAIARIAQKARAVGIHLVVATQRPSVDVITGTIKANFPSRISFAVASQIDSRTILDCPGAERLLGRGDMLFIESGSPNTIRVQGAYIKDEEIEELVLYRKRTGISSYNPEIIREDAAEDDNRDEFFEAALALYNEMNEKGEKLSASYLQRKFKIGYNRAARIMDEIKECENE